MADAYVRLIQGHDAGGGRSRGGSAHNRPSYISALGLNRFAVGAESSVFMSSRCLADSNV
jgi:hypothetical protein